MSLSSISQKQYCQKIFLCVVVGEGEGGGIKEVRLVIQGGGLSIGGSNLLHTIEFFLRRPTLIEKDHQ